ncbi:MAG: potassium channel family protein [Pseudomonadota bacterium]|nr:potassium channel family protein [Pseudomonadota bacterium]
MIDEVVRSPRHPLLRRRPLLNEWGQFALRMAMLLVLLGFIIGIHWIERDSFRDNHDNSMSFVDVIYFTMISATTTGYGDIVPISDRARLFDALVVTPIRIFFILILAGTAYTFVIKRTWNRWLMNKLQQNLTGHIIVAGHGTSGSEAVRELIARGTPSHNIVVIDCDAESLADAEQLGCAVMQGDATRDTTMTAVRVTRAKALMISAGRDDTSILICLTGRHLAPDLPITVAVRASDNELPARAAGATCVINPTSFAGLLLAGSADGAGIADYIADMASVQGSVRLHERQIEPFEVGKSLADASIGLGLRILRGTRAIGFWEGDAGKLELGDRIIEVVPEHIFPKIATG